MPQVYNLDLETMLSTLSRRQLSGSLVADVPKGKVGRESAHIEINVDSGKIVFCSLQSGKTHLTGESVLHMIAQIEVIPWIFTARHMSASSVQALIPLGAVSQTSIPRRLGTLQPTDLARLPRTHFQVYAYIDGKKTVKEIAQQLRATPEQIERVLFDLRSWNVVENK